MRFQNRNQRIKEGKKKRWVWSQHMFDHTACQWNTQSVKLFLVSVLWRNLDEGINFHKKSASTSSFKIKITLQLTKWVSAYQHCDHLLPQLCLKAFLFAVSWHVSQSCIQLKMKTQIQNPVLLRGVEVILEVHNIQIHSSSPH
jgi:hypothetical protein